MAAFASIEEALEAFGRLTDQELIALRRAARLRIGGTIYTEPTDLIYEALNRCLDGRRHWPRGVPFTVFLANAMKSIANADRQSSGARLSISACDLPGADDGAEPAGFHAWAPSAEEDAIAAESARFARARAEELASAFKDDPSARAVVAGWLAELEPNEAMQKHELSATEYKAARQRVSRKAARVARRYQ